MTEARSTSGRWRIGVRGAIAPGAELLLTDLQIEVLETITVVQTGPVRPDACASTIAKLQSLGLAVVDLRWVETEPD